MNHAVPPHSNGPQPGKVFAPDVEQPRAFRSGAATCAHRPRGSRWASSERSTAEPETLNPVDKQQRAALVSHFRQSRQVQPSPRAVTNPAYRDDASPLVASVGYCIQVHSSGPTATRRVSTLGRPGSARDIGWWGIHRPASPHCRPAPSKPSATRLTLTSTTQQGNLFGRGPQQGGSLQRRFHLPLPLRPIDIAID